MDLRERIDRRKFELYPEERHWWSFNDYATILEVMLARREDGKPVGRVLEFGPGSSTLALVEGGATHIDTLEDAKDWYDVYKPRLEGRFPGVVHVHLIDWTDPLRIPAVDQSTYDLALVDGPRGRDRLKVLEYALERATEVILPLETIAHPRFADEARAWVAAHRNVEMTESGETGPLSGAFALVRKTTRRRRSAPAADTSKPEASKPGA